MEEIKAYYINKTIDKLNSENTILVRLFFQVIYNEMMSDPFLSQLNEDDFELIVDDVYGTILSNLTERYTKND